MNPEKFTPNIPYKINPRNDIGNFSVPSFFAEGVGPAIGYDAPDINGISDGDFNDIIATATVVTPETSPTGEPWIPQFYSLGGVHYFIVQTGIVVADPGDDDGSDGGSDGGGTGGSKLPRLFKPTGLPVMSSKDRNDGRQKGDPLDPGKY